MAGWRSVLGTVVSFAFACAAQPAFADDPVVNYVRVSTSDDPHLNCNDLNIEIANVNRDIGLLESQDMQLRQVIDEGAPEAQSQSTGLGTALSILSSGLGNAAVIDAQNSIPGVEASLSTARARIGYLQSLQGSCNNNDGQAQQPPKPDIGSPQPSNLPVRLTLTCEFTSGPKAGRFEDFRGTNATPATVGGVCTDGQGSNGVGIPEQPQTQTLTCEYFQGPKAGSIQDFRGTNATPATVGGPCTDGQGSNGLGIPARAAKS